jgi:hypothetical protein
MLGGWEEDLRGPKPQESQGRRHWVKTPGPSSEPAIEEGGSRWSAGTRP